MVWFWLLVEAAITGVETAIVCAILDTYILKVLNKPIFRQDKKYSLGARAVYMLLCNLEVAVYMNWGAFACLSFVSFSVFGLTFDPLLNKFRGLGFWYVGTESVVDDIYKWVGKWAFLGEVAIFLIILTVYIWTYAQF